MLQLCTCCDSCLRAWAPDPLLCSPCNGNPFPATLLATAWGLPAGWRAELCSTVACDAQIGGSQDRLMPFYIGYNKANP